MRRCKATGHPSHDEGREPRTDRSERLRRREAAGDHERGEREQQPERRLRARLRLRIVDLDVDRIAAGPPGEAGEQAAAHVEERADVRLVADEAREEAVQAAGDAARDERDDPRGERDDERDDRPEGRPEEVRRGQHGPEAGEQPVLLALGRERHAHRMARAGQERHRARVAVREAIGEQEEVCRGLGGVAERPHLHVAHAGRHRALGQTGEPGQEGDDHRDAGAHARRRSRRGHEAAAEAAREDERRQGEREPEPHLPAVLARRSGQPGVDRVRAGPGRGSPGRDRRRGRGTRTRAASS
jgi:hypothetical protein